VTVAALVVWDLLDVSAMTGDIFTSNLVRNLPFFVFGAALALRPNYVVQVSSRPHGVTVAIAVTSAVLLVVSETLGLLESRIGSVVEAVLLTVGAFYWARLLLAIANRVLDRPKPAVEWLVDSALVIYIFHHPLVILYSHLVIQADAPPWLGFTLVTLLAFATAALIYELIALVPVLRFVTSGFSRKSKTLLGISQQRLRREATTAESS
jgi:glucan biosynthesis protein C